MRTMGQSRGIAALRASHSGMVGSDIRNSMRRWISMSARPPKYPEMPPRVTPITKVSATPARPMKRDTRAA